MANSRIQRTMNRLNPRAKQSIPDYSGTALYRYFDERIYAEAFLRGEIWISTLGSCRKAESEERRDVGEGTMEYRSGTIAGNGDSPDIRLISQRLGFDLGSDFNNISFSGITRRDTLQDAYILCLTEGANRESMAGIGDFAVKIDHPQYFFRRLTKSMEKVVLVKEWGAGKVTYKKREYEGTEDAPAHIAFLKPPDIYEKQREVRCVWLPGGSTPIEPFLVGCPEIRSLVTKQY